MKKILRTIFNKKIFNFVFVIVPIFIWYYPRIHLYSLTYKKKSKVKIYRFARRFATVSLKGLRCNLDIQGREYIENVDSAIFVGNHQSFSDTLMVIKAVKEEPLHFVAKKELGKFPGVSRFITMMGGHFMDRGNRREEIKVMRKVRNDLKYGNNIVCIFPEGTRTKNENYEMNHFLPGTFNAAVKEKKDIIPFAVEGGYNLLKWRKRMHSDCFLHILKPLKYEDYKDLTTTEIAQIVEDRVRAKQQELHKLVK